MTNKKTETPNKSKINPKTLFLILGIMIILFGGVILFNEYTLNMGEKVYLKTVPVDPRDLLRGDFVILRYEIQNNQAISELITKEELINGDSIYISLNKDQTTDVGTFKAVTVTKPESGIFIKTTVLNKNSLELGIGQYFVPEGKGYQLERLRGNLTVLTSIDKFGNAKIKDLYHNNEKFEFQEKN